MSKRIEKQAYLGRTARALQGATILSGALFLAGCSSDVMRFDGYATQFNGQEQTSSVRTAQNPLIPTVGVDSPSQGNFDDRSFSSAPLDQGNQYAATNAQGQVNSPFAVRNEQPSGFEGERFQQFVTVRPGDSLQSIASQYQLSADALAAQNGLRASDPLYAGQQLATPSNVRPAAQAPVLASSRPVAQQQAVADSYTVQPGDTLFGVARKHNMSVSELAAKNGLTTSSNIRIGQKLAISGNAPVQVAAANTQTRQIVSDAQPVREAPASITSQPLNQQAQTLASQPQPQPQTQNREVRVVAPNPALQESPLVKQVSIEPDQPPAERLTSSFRWPVTGRVVSDFGRKADGTHNDGINIAVPEGTPIKAAENGVVVYAGDEIKGYGNLILIRHADDYVTAYAHAKDILVKRGDTVTRGQDIGTAGSTGSVNAPQVHFEIRKGAKPVNPMSYLKG